MSEESQENRRWDCIICKIAVVVGPDPENQFGRCSVHRAAAECFCGRPDVVHTMELECPDRRPSRFSLCDFHEWARCMAPDMFRKEFWIMVKPGFIPGQWRIRPEWWRCSKKPLCLRLTRYLPKAGDPAPVRGWCAAHSDYAPGGSKDLSRIPEAQPGDGCAALAQGRWIRCEIVKKNPKRYHVRLPNGAVIERRAWQVRL